MRTVDYELKELEAYVEDCEYSKDLSIARLACYLMLAKDSNDEERVHSISADIVQNREVVEYVKDMVRYKWDKYGTEDLRFVYDISTKDECVDYMLNVTKGYFEEMTIETCKGLFIKSGMNNSFKFLGYFLGTRMMGAYRDWYVKAAQKRLPKITRRNVDDYQHIQRVTDYKANFRTMSNDELLALCEENGMHYTARKMENLRNHFGYASESITMIKQKSDSRARRLKNLGMTRLTIESIGIEVNEIKRVLNYSSADAQVLTDWLIRVMDTGDDTNNDVVVTDDLKSRYDFTRVFPGKRVTRSKAYANRDSSIFARMRAEIRTAYEDGKIRDSYVMSIICAKTSRCFAEIRTVA